jgi:Rps23 Pro-64 3,4-dihydroxylase Tpa1-like proline 4-hydroxylase
MSYIIIDNFLSQQNHAEIKNSILDSSAFPWFYYDYVQSNNFKNKLDKNQLFFCHTFYIDNFVKSEYLNIVLPILENMKNFDNEYVLKSLIRIKANLYPRTEEKYIHGMHRDYKWESYSAIYYVNDNNGETLLNINNEIKSIQSISNRLLIMTSDIEHTSTTCTDKKMRCTININYF